MITRRDLSSGDQATQASHAAFAFAIEHPEITREWYKYSQYLILLSVEDEISLLDLRDEARRRALKFSLFHEPDLDDSMTAIVIEPSQEARRLCSNFPLALKEKSADTEATVGV